MVQFKNKGFSMKQGLFLGLFLVVSQGALGSQGDDKLSESLSRAMSLRSDVQSSLHSRSTSCFGGILGRRLDSFNFRAQQLMEDLMNAYKKIDLAGDDSLNGDGIPEPLSLSDLNQSFNSLCKEACELRTHKDLEEDGKSPFVGDEPMTDHANYFNSSVRAALVKIVSVSRGSFSRREIPRPLNAVSNKSLTRGPKALQFQESTDVASNVLPNNPFNCTDLAELMPIPVVREEGCASSDDDSVDEYSVPKSTPEKTPRGSAVSAKYRQETPREVTPAKVVTTDDISLEI